MKVVAELLILKEIGINAEDNDGKTPLLTAVDNDADVVANLLVGHGAKYD